MALFAKNHYDLIITDIGLPDMDGFALATKIRQGINEYDMPIIGLSAHIGAAEQSARFAAGMDSIMPKPLTAEIVKGLFRAYLAFDMLDA